MAELSITSSLVTSNNAVITYRSYVTSAAVTAGQVVTQASDSSVSPADSSVAGDRILGVALTSAAATDKYVIVAVGGQYIVGATLVAGQMYALGPTAGGISLFSDLASSDYVRYLGYATSTTSLQLQINNTGVQKA
tara:strand:- start:3008 stop:3415 length:408 start_codon:yes stop_codon:yes gene_type:complete